MQLIHQLQVLQQKPHPCTAHSGTISAAKQTPCNQQPLKPADPLCDIPSDCCSFTGPWTVTRSSLRMLRRVAAFCRPLRPVLLLVSFPRSRSPVIGVLGLCCPPFIWYHDWRHTRRSGRGNLCTSLHSDRNKTLNAGGATTHLSARATPHWEFNHQSHVNRTSPPPRSGPTPGPPEDGVLWPPSNGLPRTPSLPTLRHWRGKRIPQRRWIRRQSY